MGTVLLFVLRGLFGGFFRSLVSREAVAGLCAAEAVPCAGWVRDARLPTSCISNTTHPSNANTQRPEIPRKICLPQCRTAACTGKGNPCPADPKYCRKRKEKGNGEYAMHFIHLVWQNLGYLAPPVRRYLTVFWALKIFPNLSALACSQLWVAGWVSGCSWVLNKQKVFQGSPPPSLNRIWFLFPQLTHPLRCILLCWISHVARFRGEKKNPSAHNYPVSENSRFWAESSWAVGA